MRVSRQEQLLPRGPSRRRQDGRGGGLGATHRAGGGGTCLVVELGCAKRRSRRNPNEASQTAIEVQLFGWLRRQQQGPHGKSLFMRVNTSRATNGASSAQRTKRVDEVVLLRSPVPLLHPSFSRPDGRTCRCLHACVGSSSTPWTWGNWSPEGREEVRVSDRDRAAGVGRRVRRSFSEQREVKRSTRQSSFFCFGSCRRGFDWSKDVKWYLVFFWLRG